MVFQSMFNHLAQHSTTHLGNCVATAWKPRLAVVAVVRARSMLVGGGVVVPSRPPVRMAPSLPPQLPMVWQMARHASLEGRCRLGAGAAVEVAAAEGRRPLPLVCR